jgi:Phage tail tube protein
MAYQSAKNVRVAYKAETTFNVLPTAGGATQFRVNSGTLNLTKAPIVSNEVRPDGLISRGRHGQRDVGGAYEGDLSLGTFDALFAAAFRSTFVAALVITNSPSITTTTSTIVGASGDWFAAGLRIGDVIKFSGLADAANNNKNLHITALTATIITVAETLVANAVGDTTYTLTRPKKLLQGTTPTSFTFEETENDIDGSEIFSGVRVGSMTLTMAPNEMAKINFGVVGANMQTMTAANSPYFTSPTNTTGVGMTAVEAKLFLNGVAVVDLTALTLGIDLGAAGIPIVGATITPDVFTNSANVTGSITSLRQDLARVGNFLAEDVLSLQATFEDTLAAPKGFISFYVPNLTFASATKSELGADGPRTQEQTLLIGADDRGTALGFDPTAIKIITSAA